MRYGETMLGDVGELIYEGKDLKAVAEKSGISVVELVKILKIPLNRVEFITTVEELEKAYKELSESKERQIVINRMDKYLLKELELVPKDIDNVGKIFIIYKQAFEENKVKQIAKDEINNICLPFLEKATVDDLKRIRWLSNIAKEEMVEIAKKVGEIFNQLDLEYYGIEESKKEKEYQELIKKTEELEEFEKIEDNFYQQRGKEYQLFLEKFDRRCLEEAKKAALSKDFKKLHEIYEICIQRHDRFRGYQLKAEKFILSSWKEICLKEVDDNPEILKDLQICDYNDGESDYLTVGPGAYSILDELCTIKIIAANTLNEVEKWNGIAPCHFWWKSEAGEAAKKRKWEIFFEQLTKATTLDEAQEIYNNPLADSFVKEMAVKRTFELF